MNEISHDSESRIPRRTVLQWFAAAAASGAAIPSAGLGASAPGAKGYGSDPDLMKIYQPGEVWPLTLSGEQKKIATALADTILPEDDFGPAASTVRVPDYIDEWVSAPYPRQERDRKVVIPGLEKFEAAAREKYGSGFAELTVDQRNEFCEWIVSGEGKPHAGFFHAFTMIAAGAYFSTQEGWKAIGYEGNIASGIFAGPPQEVLDQVGVEQTVS